MPSPDKRSSEPSDISHNNHLNIIRTRRLLGYGLRADSWDNQSECSDIHGINVTRQCEFVKTVDSCQQEEGFINYNTLVYCHFQNLLVLGMIVLILWWLVLFVGLAVAADDFFCPSLVVIAKTLRLPDNITGVTLMAFGNGAPDVFSAIAAIHNGNGDAGLAFGALFGAGVFVTTVVPGAIAMVTSFHAMERPFLRDITFYIAAVFYAFTVMYEGKITTPKAIGFILLYVVYVIVVVAGRYIYQRHKRKQQEKAKSNGQIQDSVEEKVDDDEPVSIARQSRLAPISADPDHDMEDSATESTPLLKPPQKERGPAWKEFLQAINPINTAEWRYMKLHSKLYEIFKAPVYLVLLLTVPVVDYEEETVNNWNRYLNVLQVAVGPTVGALLFNHRAVMIYINDIFPIWGVILLVSCALAALVYFTSKNEEPPVYHAAFAFLGFLMAVIWIESIANEVVNIMETFGVVLKISSAILGLTLLAWGNSIGDLVADVAMAKQGYPRAGISACFGGPLFNLLLGIGIPFTLACIRNGGISGVFMIQFKLIQVVLAGGLALSLIVNLIMLVAIKFNISRVYGAVLFVVYALFLTVAILVETGVIKAKL